MRGTPGSGSGAGGDELAALRRRVADLHAIVENVEDGLVLVDQDGVIQYINQAYLQFLGITAEQAVGRPVQAVIENTRMHVVVRTGVPEVGWTQKIKGHEMVVKRLPIFQDGKLVGAVGSVMFKDISELKALAARVGLLQAKVEYYERELKDLRGARYTFDHIISISPSMARAKDLARRAAQSDASILLLGESGTGKELFAHAIHHASPRAAGPLVRINCAAIPAELLEAELFGYEAGAFTGARRGGKPGKFELASRGTLLLDEIGDMPLAMQAKILRVLQEREVERVGAVGPVPVDVRIIAATHQDLEALVAAGRFREDLYYRLNVISLRIPPLRERAEDVPALAEYTLSRLAEEQGALPKRLAPDVLSLLVRYPWPGNARELVNLMERLIHTAEGAVIQRSDLPPGFAARLGLPVPPGGPVPAPASPGGARSGRPPLGAALAEAERQEIRRALELAGGNRSQAARLLGIHRATLYEKLRRHRLCDPASG